MYKYLKFVRLNEPCKYKKQVEMFMLIFLLSSITYSNAVLVNTLSGPVLGSEVFHGGKLVKRFLGIPYAEPPAGRLRFKKTVPVRPWTEPRRATTYKPACTQNYPFSYPWVDEMPGRSEDCLFLNIWVPETASPEYFKAVAGSDRSPDNDGILAEKDIIVITINYRLGVLRFLSPSSEEAPGNMENATRNSLKSVMFWIHGGGYSTGSSRLPDYDGKVLAAEKDVIVVTMNYRLGILGFLSTPSEEAPGNMGLYDVLEALKWTNNNIGAFGGNSESITLFGDGVGSVISGFFLVSPLTRGLFQRVIMQSGAPSPFREEYYSFNLQLGQKVAKTVGCASEDLTLENNPEEIVRCLRSKTADDLNEAVTSFAKATLAGFRPVYGSEFLPTNPFDAVARDSFQPVDVLIGSVRDEGSFEACSTFPEIFGPYGEKNPSVNKTLGRELLNKIFKGIDSADEIADYYLNNVLENDYDIVRSQTYHSQGDYVTVCPGVYWARQLSSKGNNIYSYYYNHRSANTIFAPWTGVTHYTDVPLVFGRPFDGMFRYPKEERILSKILMEFWSNFAKNGFPSSTWKRFSYPEYYTEQIGTDDNFDSYFLNQRINCEFLRKYTLPNFENKYT